MSISLVGSSPFGVPAVAPHGEQGDITVGAAHGEQGDISAPPPHSEQGDIGMQGRLANASMFSSMLGRAGGAATEPAPGLLRAMILGNPARSAGALTGPSPPDVWRLMM